ncbi:MAG: TauD/TfdA family dioxygenase [Rhodospirillaceae bacterium]|nr:TauD/TfdA family dioxygenase [Rhodospirillaceae bacterium]
MSLEHDISGAIAWRGDEVSAEVGHFTLPDAARVELMNVAKLLAANPLPTIALDAAEFELSACAAYLTGIKRELDDGHGFALIDGFPIEEAGRDVVLALYYLLAQLIARPVAQSWDGKMIYDVRDTGKPAGNGVRPDVTNAHQNLHTDNSYNLCPPDYVALLCLQTAMEGGVSRIVSFARAHNQMRQQHPTLLPRLYDDYVFDRQREHAPDDVMYIRHPLFEWDGQVLRGRLSRRMVRQGYELASETPDEPGLEAIDALEEIMNGPGRAKEFNFQPGQIQIVNNRTLGHSRTGFTDWPEPERKRHLVRLWLRDRGRRFYNG